MDVFLSYASDDKKVASRLAQDLESEGLRVWTDSTELKPGENWLRALLSAIRSAPNFVVLVSRQTTKKSVFCYRASGSDCRHESLNIATNCARPDR